MPRNKLKRERLVAKRRRKAVKRQKVLARRGTRSKAGRVADRSIDKAFMGLTMAELLQSIRHA